MSIATTRRRLSTPIFGRHPSTLWPVFLAIALIGLVGAVLGAWGALTTLHADMVGTVSVSGLSHAVFQWLAIGGFVVMALGVIGLYAARQAR